MGDHDGGGGDGLRGWSPGDYCCVGGHYLLVSRLGKGSFGEIFEGVDTATDLRVAVKVEHLKKRNPHLLHESKLYKLLQGVTGVPKIYWYGTEYQYSILVMDLLGPSTEDLFERAGRQFSRKTSLMIMYQYLSRMEGIHKAGVIHRDIKPHNFVIGRSRCYDPEDEQTTLVYVIDFGLSKRYCDSRHVHLPYKEGRNLTGTARYVSINTHYGVEPSRRDDLESCFYVMLYFLRGSLPWQGLRANTKKEKYLRIMERKIASTPASLCASMPVALTEMLSRIRAMRYAEDPDYHYLKSTIAGLITQWGSQLDFHYDWHTPAPPDPQEDALWANPKFHTAEDATPSTVVVVEDVMEEEGAYTAKRKHQLKQLSGEGENLTQNNPIQPTAAAAAVQPSPAQPSAAAATVQSVQPAQPPLHQPHIISQSSTTVQHHNPNNNSPNNNSNSPTSPNSRGHHQLGRFMSHPTNPAAPPPYRSSTTEAYTRFPLVPREFLTRRSNGTFEVPIRGSVVPRDSRPSLTKATANSHSVLTSPGVLINNSPNEGSSPVVNNKRLLNRNVALADEPTRHHPLLPGLLFSKSINAHEVQKGAGHVNLNQLVEKDL